MTVNADKEFSLGDLIQRKPMPVGFFNGIFYAKGNEKYCQTLFLVLGIETSQTLVERRSSNRGTYQKIILLNENGGVQKTPYYSEDWVKVEIL